MGYDWLKGDEQKSLPVNCINCIAKHGHPVIKSDKQGNKTIFKSTAVRPMNECREKMLIECDPPEFDDCIRLDRKCYDAARELDEQKKLTKAKSSLLAQRKREHMMVKMFGQGYWRKK